MIDAGALQRGDRIETFCHFRRHWWNLHRLRAAGQGAREHHDLEVAAVELHAEQLARDLRAVARAAVAQRRLVEEVRHHVLAVLVEQVADERAPLVGDGAFVYTLGALPCLANASQLAAALQAKAALRIYLLFCR